MAQYEPDECGPFGQCGPLYNDEAIWKISCDADVIFCPKCCFVLVLCCSCHSQCLFLGHDGYSHLLGLPGACEGFDGTDLATIPYYHPEPFGYNFSTSEYDITGPDGGYSHYWMCQRAGCKMNGVVAVHSDK